MRQHDNDRAGNANHYLLNTLEPSINAAHLLLDAFIPNRANINVRVDLGFNF